MAVFDWMFFTALKATSDVLVAVYKKHTDVSGVMSRGLVETDRSFRAKHCL